MSNNNPDPEIVFCFRDGLRHVWKRSEKTISVKSGLLTSIKVNAPGGILSCKVTFTLSDRDDTHRSYKLKANEGILERFDMISIKGKTILLSYVCDDGKTILYNWDRKIKFV